MEWTREEAFDFLKELYDDQIMQQEKRRVFKMLHRQLYERLDDLAINQAISEKAERQLYLFKEFTFMPGDNIFQSMRYLFLIARGEMEIDRQLTRKHLQRVYQSLFQPAALKTQSYLNHFGKRHWELLARLLRMASKPSIRY